MHDAAHWFETPVAVLSRAQCFDETVVGRPMRRESLGLHAPA